MERDSHNKSLLFQNALHRILNRVHSCHLHHFPATTSIKRITMLSFNTHADKRFILRLLAILFLLLHLDSIWPFCGNRTQKKHTNTHSSLETSSTDCLAEVISAIQCFLYVIKIAFKHLFSILRLFSFATDSVTENNKRRICVFIYYLPKMFETLQASCRRNFPPDGINNHDGKIVIDMILV